MVKKSNSLTSVNPLAEQLKEEYVSLWKDMNLQKLFGRHLKSKDKSEWILERDKQKSIPKKIDCKPDEIPYIEISNRMIKESPILFVGMNPSGTDTASYIDNTNDVFVYDGGSPYYKEMAKFAEKCLGFEDGFSELDLFGIVQSSQSIIQQDFLERPDCYKGMFDLFLKYVVILQPKVVVVANAFVRRILCKEFINDPKFTSFYSTNFSLTDNDQFGGFTFTINEFSTQLYFSSMLSGQRALDLGSRGNLIWLVKNYLMS